MGDRLAGKVAILAGGATGMGRATALRFAEEGAKVMIADRNVAGAQETMAMVKKITPDVDMVAVDVSKWDQVQNMVDRTVDRFGRVDVLVNLAAILMLTPPLVDIEERQWDLIMDTNLKGTFLTCKAAIPVMLQAWQRLNRQHLLVGWPGRLDPLPALQHQQGRGHSPDLRHFRPVHVPGHSRQLRSARPGGHPPGQG